MARIVFEGNYKVFWVETIADISAPTVAEMTAGTDITEYVPKDGLRYGPGFNKVDASNISSGFDPEYQGSWRMDAGLTLQWDDTNNTALDLFTTHGTLGHVVALPQATDSSPAASDKAFVLPSDASIGVPNNTAANALQTGEVSIAVTSEPNFNAAIAA
jgi:hypothetical protein